MTKQPVVIRSVRLPKDLDRQAKAVARQRGFSVAWLIREGLRLAIAQETPK